MFISESGKNVLLGSLQSTCSALLFGFIGVMVEQEGLQKVRKFLDFIV